MENAQAQTSRYSGGALFNMTKQFDSLVTRGMALFNAIFHFKFCLLKACGASYLKFILNFLAALEIYFKSTFALQTIQSFMLANTQHKVPCEEKKNKISYMYMSSVPNDYKKWYAENSTKWCHFKMTVLFGAF